VIDNSNDSIFGAILTSAIALLKVFSATVLLLGAIFFLLNDFEISTALNRTIEHLDLLAVALILGFLCDISYRIYLVIHKKKQNK